jgi:hypothetical protein
VLVASSYIVLGFVVGVTKYEYEVPNYMVRFASPGTSLRKRRVTKHSGSSRVVGVSTVNAYIDIYCGLVSRVGLFTSFAKHAVNYFVFATGLKPAVRNSRW